MSRRQGLNLARAARIARRRGQYSNVENFLDRKRLGQAGAFPGAPFFDSSTWSPEPSGAGCNRVTPAPHLEDLDRGGGEN